MSIEPRGWALVTGASRGIGAEFARALAARGHDLVLVARPSADLDALAAELADRHGCRVRVEPADLAVEGAGTAVAERLLAAGLAIEVLINNAATVTRGSLYRIEAGLDHRLTMLNTVAVVDLCRALLPPMVERRHGLILNVASLGAFQPAPFLAAYAASKAFLLSFSEGVAHELAGSGVSMVVLCPGPVRTGFFAGHGSTDGSVGQPLDARTVVDIALRRAARGDRVIIPGRLNALAAQGARLLPRRVITAIAGRATGPGPTG